MFENCICEIKKGVSKKTNSEYICLEITFPNGFKKVVFPKGSAELYLFNEMYNLMKGDSR